MLWWSHFHCFFSRSRTIRISWLFQSLVLTLVFDSMRNINILFDVTKFSINNWSDFTAASIWSRFSALTSLHTTQHTVPSVKAWMSINKLCMMCAIRYCFYFPGTVVMKQGQVVALGQHEKPKETRLVFEVVKQCTDSSDAVLCLGVKKHEAVSANVGITLFIVTVIRHFSFSSRYSDIA